MTARLSGTLIPAKIGQPLIAEGHLRLGEDGRLYRYESGVYRPDGEQWLRVRAAHELALDFRQSVVNEVVAYAKTQMNTAFNATDLVNLKNGLLDPLSGQLQPHSPDYLSIVQLPIAWDPRATSPAIDAFLDQVLESSLHPLIEEIIGLLLTPETRYRKAVLLHGTGQNGKSTLLTVIRSLLGAANVSAVSFQALSSDRFKVAELAGKLANISADIDYRAVSDTSVFKMITGGTDFLTGERKYGAPFMFLPTARLLFSANEAPGSTDHSAAYFDRWLLLPMDRRISQPVRDLDAKLTTPDELAGLLVRAVSGLVRLSQRGQFDPPALASDALSQYRSSVDPVIAFLDDETILGPDQRASRQELLSRFQSFSRENGYAQLSPKVFAARVRNHRPSVNEGKSNGTRVWTGIGLRPATR